MAHSAISREAIQTGAGVRWSAGVAAAGAFSDVTVVCPPMTVIVVMVHFYNGKNTDMLLRRE